jgi:hypothetical protein
MALFRSSPATNGGGGSLTVRAPLRAPSAPVATPILRAAPTGVVVKPGPIVPIGQRPITSVITNPMPMPPRGVTITGTRQPPTAIPGGTLTPFRGTIAAPAPGVPPVAPGVPVHGTIARPVGIHAPTLAPSGGGIIQAQPAGPPPSGAPPSMSLPGPATPAPVDQMSAGVTLPIVGSIPQGWILLGAVALIVFVIVTRD